MPNLHYSSADNLPSLQSTVQEEEEDEEEEEPDNTEATQATANYDNNKAEKAEREEKKADLETPTFSVGDIRRRLTQEFEAPQKQSLRDPEDPSGLYT